MAAIEATTTAQHPSQRLASLDAFRGLAVAAMVLVNNPGDWSHVYWPLLHAEWNGWTPTDLVFPFFVFIVGVAITFSRRASVASAARRSLVLIGLGLFMAAYPHFDLAHLRYPGVLQRIGVAYFFAFLAKRFLGLRWRVALTAALLVGYWLVMTQVPVPGGQPPNLEPATNLGAWLDRTVMGGHLWAESKAWDPEGILSTFPTIATALLGLFAGEWLRSPRSGRAKARGLYVAGATATAVGWIWGLWFPINKSLWTSSYVLFTGGAAALLLGLFLDLIDLRHLRGWDRPLVVYGRNAITLFVGSGLLVRTMIWFGWWKPLYEHGFATWLPPYLASLTFAITNLVFWYLILWWMDRRRIYLTV